MRRYQPALTLFIFGLALTQATVASPSNPTANIAVTATSTVTYRNAKGRAFHARFRGDGVAVCKPANLSFNLPQVTKTGRGGNVYGRLSIDLTSLSYRAQQRDYAGTGSATAYVGGDSQQVQTRARVAVKQSSAGITLRGQMSGRSNGVNVSTTIRGSAGTLTKVTDGKTPRGTVLPVKPMNWKDVPWRFRPPKSDKIAEVISPNHPRLAEKLRNTKRKGWLIIRGNKPFPLNEFEFAGWVKIECPRMDLTWQHNSIRGLTGDDRLWLEGVTVNGPGDATIFQFVNALYTDRCLFKNFGHVILDTGQWTEFGGCVMNTEFRNNFHDPFQYFGGAVINVAITSMAHDASAHPDLFQTTHSRSVYWKHVWCGTARNPITMMGIRGFSIRDSHFEDVHHYQYPGTGHYSLDIQDATGTVFKDCVLTGQLRAHGAKYK